MKRILALSSLALALALSPAQAEVKNGEPAPDFTLTDSNGKSHKLSDFKGKLVVLEWTNADCPFVVKHYASNNMQKLQKELTSQEIVWLTINSSAEGKQGHCTPEQANEKVKKSGAAPTAVLLDSDGKVGKQYGAKTTPHMYIVDKQGVLQYQGAIDSDTSPKQDAIAGAENYVKTAVDEILAGKPVTKANTKPYGCSVKYKD